MTKFLALVVVVLSGISLTPAISDECPPCVIRFDQSLRETGGQSQYQYRCVLEKPICGNVGELQITQHLAAIPQNINGNAVYSTQGYIKDKCERPEGSPPDSGDTSYYWSDITSATTSVEDDIHKDNPFKTPFASHCLHMDECVKRYYINDVEKEGNTLAFLGQTIKCKGFIKLNEGEREVYSSEFKMTLELALLQQNEQVDAQDGGGTPEFACGPIGPDCKFNPRKAKHLVPLEGPGTVPSTPGNITGGTPPAPQKEDFLCHCEALNEFNGYTGNTFSCIVLRNNSNSKNLGLGRIGETNLYGIKTHEQCRTLCRPNVEKAREGYGGAAFNVCFGNQHEN